MNAIDSMKIKFYHVPDFGDIAGLYIDGKLGYFTIEGINSLTDKNQGNEENLIELELSLIHI